MRARGREAQQDPLSITPSLIRRANVQLDRAENITTFGDRYKSHSLSTGPSAVYNIERQHSSLLAN